MKAGNVVIAFVLVAFTAYSILVVVQHGYFGFMSLAYHQPWAMQMLLDLTIALFLVGRWLRRDAQTRKINPLPYMVGLVFVGSISPLVYLLHRQLKR